jgi:hypothetical protein
MMDGIHALQIFLGAQPPGPIQDTKQLVRLLSSCWDEFAGSSYTNMESEKLYRIEEPEWLADPFILNRKAREWSVDLENLTASIVRERKRQLEPNAKRLDVKPIAQTIADAILSGRSDERFKIMRDGKVKIEIGRVIPETNAQTTLACRRRFRKELTSFLEPHGLKEVRPNVYAQSEGN